jgi:excisionase family DNA binding protein
VSTETLKKVDEVARRLNTSTKTVRRLVAEGALPAIRLSPNGHFRFAEEDVERFLERARGPPA